MSTRPAVVTRDGVPIAEDEYEDWVLATAHEFVDSMRETDGDAVVGRTS